MSLHAPRSRASADALRVTIGAFALALSFTACRPAAAPESSAASSTGPPPTAAPSPAAAGPPAGNDAPTEAAAKDPCGEAETQSDLTACWTRVASEARARATTTYERAQEWLAQRSQPAAQQRLKQAQSSWDRYRTAYCGAVAAVYEGGSVAGTQKAHCEATLDTQHADQIDALMSDASGP